MGLLATGFDLPDWMREGWDVLRDGPVTALVRRDFRVAFREAGLRAAADREPRELGDRAEPFRPDGGRGTLAIVPAGGLGEAVVRPYRRGGLPGQWLDRRYLLGDRAFDELLLTLELERAGVPAVEPLAAVQSRRPPGWPPGYRAALVTRRVREAAPAPEALASRIRGRRRRALRRMGAATRALHRAGGHHPDLNAHNYLLPGEEHPGRGGAAAGPPAAVLLDFDRARRLPVAVPRPLAVLALRRLRRSLRKLGLRRALDDWEAFEETYSAGR